MACLIAVEPVEFRLILSDHVLRKSMAYKARIGFWGLLSCHECDRTVRPEISMAVDAMQLSTSKERTVPSKLDAATDRSIASDGCTTSS